MNSELAKRATAVSNDAGPIGAGAIDARLIDAGLVDAGTIGAGPIGARPIDTGPNVAGLIDAGPIDAGIIALIREGGTSGLFPNLYGSSLHFFIGWKVKAFWVSIVVVWKTHQIISSYVLTFPSLYY